MNINPATAAAWLCALLALSTMAELTSARSVPASDVEEFLMEADSEGVTDNFHFSRGRTRKFTFIYRTRYCDYCVACLAYDFVVQHF